MANYRAGRNWNPYSYESPPNKANKRKKGYLSKSQSKKNAKIYGNIFEKYKTEKGVAFEIGRMKRAGRTAKEICDILNENMAAPFEGGWSIEALREFCEQLGVDLTTPRLRSWKSGSRRR